MNNIVRKMRSLIVIMLCVAIVVPAVDISAAMNETKYVMSGEESTSIEETESTEEPASSEETEPTEEPGSPEETEPTEESGSPEETEPTEESGSPEETESTEEPASTEEVESTEESSATELPAAAFYEEKKIGQFYIRVSAPEGVFPEGAVLHVEEVGDQKDEIKTAVAGEVPAEVKRVDMLAAFDITVVDQDGFEIQPDDLMGEVSVVFGNVDTESAEQDEETDIQVFHIADDHQSATAMETQVKEAEVVIETTHFSRYAVMLMIRRSTRDQEFELKDFLKQTILMTGNSSEAVEDESEISFADSLTLRIGFNTITADDSENITNKEYELGTIPVGLFITPGKWTVQATGPDDVEFVLGTAKLGEDRILVFQFNLVEGVKDKIKGQELQNIFIDCSSTLDKNVIENNKSYMIDLSSLSGGLVTINPAENQQRNPSVSKEGKHEDRKSVV